jgi:predicted GIY-YIG superfamily endonuclease
MESYTLYVLRDPRDNAIRYIGQTNNPRTRRQDHERGAGAAHCGCWERYLLSLGLKPIFEELVCVSSKAHINELEIKLIEFGREIGLRLTNLEDGGTGGPRIGWHHSEETKQKISIGAKKRQAKRCAEEWQHSEEVRAKLSLMNSGEGNPRHGKPVLEATRERIGAANAKTYPAFRNVFSGETIPSGKNLASLSRSLGIDTTGMSKLVTGKKDYYRGWVLADSPLSVEDVKVRPARCTI